MESSNGLNIQESHRFVWQFCHYQTMSYRAAQNCGMKYCRKCSRVIPSLGRLMGNVAATFHATISGSRPLSKNSPYPALSIIYSLHSWRISLERDGHPGVETANRDHKKVNEGCTVQGAYNQREEHKYFIDSIIVAMYWNIHVEDISFLHQMNVLLASVTLILILNVILKNSRSPLILSEN